MCCSGFAQEDGTPSSSEPVVATELGERCDALLRRFADYGFAGVAQVSVTGETALLRGYGLANRERGIAHTPATLFDFASIVKTFTGAAILKLEEDGEPRLIHTVRGVGYVLREQ